ncbi:uncharacterized protein [Lepeophtheirus salmonis]|nr:uncharacterized protein LOC121127977 [Lepeophtheirus salmonis]
MIWPIFIYILFGIFISLFSLFGSCYPKIDISSKDDPLTYFLKHQKSFVHCEEELIKNLERKNNGTGTLIISVKENEIKFCSNLCNTPEKIDEYCSRKETGYLNEFKANVKDDRCCDSKSCKCICHYSCKTFDDIENELKIQGYRRCFYNKSAKNIKEVIVRTCKKRNYIRKKKCHKDKKDPLCVHKVVCRQNESECIGCINQECVTQEEKKITSIIIEGEQKLKTKEMKKQEKMDQLIEDYNDEVNQYFSKAEESTGKKNGDISKNENGSLHESVTLLPEITVDPEGAILKHSEIGVI